MVVELSSSLATWWMRVPKSPPRSLRFRVWIRRNYFRSSSFLLSLIFSVPDFLSSLPDGRPWRAFSSKQWFCRSLEWSAEAYAWFLGRRCFFSKFLSIARGKMYQKLRALCYKSRLSKYQIVWRNTEHADELNTAVGGSKSSFPRFKHPFSRWVNKENGVQADPQKVRAKNPRNGLP